MGQIDYKRVFGMIICLWILGCLGLFGREYICIIGKYYEELVNRISFKLRGVF